MHVSGAAMGSSARDPSGGSSRQWQYGQRVWVTQLLQEGDLTLRVCSPLLKGSRRPHRLGTL